MYCKNIDYEIRFCKNTESFVMKSINMQGGFSFCAGWNYLSKCYDGKVLGKTVNSDGRGVTSYIQRIIQPHKCQLTSKEHFGVFKSTKKPFNFCTDFCSSL